MSIHTTYKFTVSSYTEPTATYTFDLLNLADQKSIIDLYKEKESGKIYSVRPVPAWDAQCEYPYSGCICKL